jgi:hypothetical protein
MVLGGDKYWVLGYTHLGNWIWYKRLFEMRRREEMFVVFGQLTVLRG